jgi:hypothetical protein
MLTKAQAVQAQSFLMAHARHLKARAEALRDPSDAADAREASEDCEALAFAVGAHWVETQTRAEAERNRNVRA